MIFKGARYDTNSIIWNSGDPCNYAIFIKEGLLKFATSNDDEKEQEMKVKIICFKEFI